MTEAFSRRTFLAGGAVTGTAIVTGWGLSPWIGDVFARRGSFVYPNRPPGWPGVETVYSVCKQCGSDCGLAAQVFDGVLQKLDGNPYHPAATEPHAPYETPPAAADVWPAPHSLCPRGQAGRQTLYDPYRLRQPLKRSGPRGSGRWQTISWRQLIDEVVNGGRLFADVPGEERRHVRGLRALWDGGRGRFRPIDRENPDFGPQTNGLVIYFGQAEDGQADFLGRFAGAFGTVNLESADAICDLNRMTGTMLSLDGMADTLRPDVLNAEYILFFGVNALEGSFPMQTLARKLAAATASGRLRYDIVDVRAGNALLHANRYVCVKPGADGALAMGMVRAILESGLYDRSYLSLPTQKAAEDAGHPTHTNAGWLVVADPDHASYGRFLTTAEAGVRAGRDSGQMRTMASAAAGGDGPVVLDATSGMPAAAAKAAAARLWPHGALDAAPVHVNGIACCTSLQLLWAEASRLSLDEYAREAGVSRETIVELAREFTSHGTRAVADFGRGPTMHSNGTYTGRAIMTLNFLIGNVDWAGGYVAGSEGADILGEEEGAPYELSSWPGQPKDVPGGVPISRSGARYEDSSAYARAVAAGTSPYPAPRPWFPFGGGQWPEMFAGIYQGYPYRCEILIQHIANPAWSAPALAGADDAELPWQRLITDTEKVPLFVAIDTLVSESSSYADYIVPDTTYLEGWEFPGVAPIVPSLAQGVRRPVVEPLTDRTPDGAPMCMEQFLIDAARELGLPGFGDNAFAEGRELAVREDYYLKMVANIAFDPSFRRWRRGRLEPLGAVPDAGAAELAAIEPLRRAHGRALTDAQWRKAAYVLARGGRFEDAAAGYEPNRDVQERLLEYVRSQLLPTGVLRWAQAPGQPSPDALRKQVERSLALPRGAGGLSWMASRYGEGGIPCQIYNEDVARTRHPLTGKRFVGTAYYEPPHDLRGRPLDRLDPPARYPFVLTTYKTAVQSKSFTIADPWLLELAPEAFVDMSPIDAQRLGLRAGDSVRVHSSTYPRGIVGRVRPLPGVRPGVVVFPHGYGHWQYGSGGYSVNGRKADGDRARNAPVRLNALMRLDPALAAPDGWTIGLLDPLGGGQAYFETRVAVERV